MKYHDGSEVVLGDRVMIRMAEGYVEARVVMLGDTRTHLALEESFLEWVQTSGVLRPNQVVVEWTDRNPLAHEDPAFAPVGNQLFTSLDCCVIPVRT